jgi:hypothetical protein
LVSTASVPSPASISCYWRTSCWHSVPGHVGTSTGCTISGGCSTGGAGGGGAATGGKPRNVWRLLVMRGTPSFCDVVFAPAFLRFPPWPRAILWANCLVCVSEKAKTTAGTPQLLSWPSAFHVRREWHTARPTNSRKVTISKYLLTH